MSDERIPEIIELEIIDVAVNKRERKPKATYEEMFDNFPRRQVLLDTLTEGEKQCSVCETKMVPIGIKIARTELVFYPAYLERVDYMGPPMNVPHAKNRRSPSSLKRKVLNL